MNYTIVGLLTGLLLALAGIVGGFSGFVLALFLGAVGVAVGAHFDGRLDLTSLLRSRGRG
ncbi:DUF2273 domain-containing protein [Rhodococcus sp. BP-252]|uniref:DUF2273 domain-containing protein n=1 Tax=Rhodococcoides kyotonense TaxID=398843 RepID=A0A177YB71_9NOCA|nr:MULTISPECIES: DUF2273 domain-containing protein [Rhodococcus]MBY6411750.1 DUF2273 domain-containing protein [Rhodococcus sp. BP-320]MBY6417265.1 DUF2273 domain-containing protein [Rhodococcus sp. BP-321]MBY6421950.1 DUF2273 domain-containing protein [Rhodococcus sp. BP-324]MBY6427289.1 DUF2273 domain-containing protein [Rhodococcus sp. BP-323]MBY6432568.1 DUF2273 domain-containing protein [Rhodococcus sp. BP-322]